MADKTIKKIEDKKWIKPAIWVFTFVVFGLVIAMDSLPKPDVAPGFTKALPAVNAIINSCCFITLVVAVIAIKKKNVELHMRLNTFAMLLSIFFLLSYVLYHLTNENTPYGGDSAGAYYVILFSHIILSGVSLPFILFAYHAAFTGDIKRHKKIVKYAFPMWLYVAATGPIVYLMLSPYYS